MHPCLQLMIEYAVHHLMPLHQGLASEGFRNHLNAATTHPICYTYIDTTPFYFVLQLRPQRQQQQQKKEQKQQQQWQEQQQDAAIQQGLLFVEEVVVQALQLRWEHVMEVHAQQLRHMHLACNTYSK